MLLMSRFLVVFFTPLTVYPRSLSSRGTMSVLMKSNRSSNTGGLSDCCQFRQKSFRIWVMMLPLAESHPP